MLWPLYQVTIKKKKGNDQMEIDQMFVGNARETLQKLIKSFNLDEVGYLITF